MLSSNLVEDGSLAVRFQFAMVERIQGHDELESRKSRGQLEEDWDMGERADDASKLGVVDDVFSGLGSQGFVDGDGEERLTDSAKICIIAAKG